MRKQKYPGIPHATLGVRATREEVQHLNRMFGEVGLKDERQRYMAILRYVSMMAVVDKHSTDAGMVYDELAKN